MVIKTPPDAEMTCKTCGPQPHRFQPSSEAGPYWRCSSCGEPAPGPEDVEQARLDRFFTDAGVDPREDPFGIRRVAPPSGQPFAIVGTVEARLSTMLKDSDARLACMGDVTAHRDHLASQVTELQVSNTALLERAREAETLATAANARATELQGVNVTLLLREETATRGALFAEADRLDAIQARTDALHLAELLDELEAEEFVHPPLPEATRCIVARVLSNGGKTPKHPETLALAGKAVP